MNDQQWFNKEPSYFDMLLDKWKDEFHKSELYRKHVVNRFDLTTTLNQSAPTIKSSGISR